VSALALARCSRRVAMEPAPRHARYLIRTVSTTSRNPKSRAHESKRSSRAKVAKRSTQSWVAKDNTVGAFPWLTMLPIAGS
jgi:hypothetical protein